MADKPHFTAAQVIAALQETKGMMFLAAKRLGCSHETIRRYCQRYPTVQAAKDAERGEMVDTAELKLWQSIQNGEAWGIAYCLSRLGKDRGYVERVEQELGANTLAALTQRLDALPETALHELVTPNGEAAALPHRERAHG